MAFPLLPLVAGVAALYMLKESYDGMHAALSQGRGDMVIDMDANLEADKIITLLHSLASGEHVIYEALLAAPERKGTKNRK